MNNVKLLAIDLAKNKFQLHGNDEFGNCVYKKQIIRSKLMETIENFPKCTIVMETCGGANHWCRQFDKMGHISKQVPAKYVKPFVKTAKNDANDAEAIAEAASRPYMTFSKTKQIDTQDIQSIHRVRSLYVKNQTALSNQIRGLLTEYGIVAPLSLVKLKIVIQDELENTENDLSTSMRNVIDDLYNQLLSLEKKVCSYRKIITELSQKDSNCVLLQSIPGVGPMTATAVMSLMGNPDDYKNGRQFAAFLGLVPRQNSSGGKTKLSGITKYGDTYVRTLLVHGARSVVNYCKGKKDPRSQWIANKWNTIGYNKTSIAVANKTARMCIAIIKTQKPYLVA
jgi:transposase